jgi:polyferredoxin
MAQKKKRQFRSPVVTWRYVVNTAIVLVLILVPSFKIIKFDFTHGEFFLLGNPSTFVITTSVFLAVWAGSYVITLLADFVWGRLFCGWICSFGSLLRSVSYTIDQTKRKKLPSYAPQLFTSIAAVLSTLGLMNWFFDLGVLVHPGDSWFVVMMSLFVSLSAIGWFMLWKVGLKFCQVYCPIGWYLTAVSQKHALRISFNEASCTHHDVCVRECPMALDPKALNDMTDTNSHSLCILCGDCLTACNKCAAKVPGEKPLSLEFTTIAVEPEKLQTISV